MVYMPESWKMAALLGLSENQMDISPEELTRANIAAHIKCKELFDIDEPNLLEEEDMSIFGCRPMTDPLDLVLCNACERPIKASQYGKHAELCTSADICKDNSVTVHGDLLGQKKPPKKGKKNGPTCNNNHIIRIKVKENCNEVVHRSDNKLDSACENKCNPPAPAQTTEVPMFSLKVENVVPNVASKFRISDPPAPLATKRYYSQRNNILRVELGRLFSESCAKESPSNFVMANSTHVNGLIDFQKRCLDLPQDPEQFECTNSQRACIDMPTQMQETKSRTEMQVPVTASKVGKSKKNAMAVSYPSSSGLSRTKQLPNGRVPVT